MGNTANQVWEAISSHSAALAEQAGTAIVAVDAVARDGFPDLVCGVTHLLTPDAYNSASGSSMA